MAKSTSVFRDHSGKETWPLLLHYKAVHIRTHEQSHAVRSTVQNTHAHVNGKKSKN